MKKSVVRAAAKKTLLAAAALSIAAPFAASAEEAKAAPAMWRLKDANSEVYLFGTFHILPKDVQWTTPAFEAAMKATETTMTEADVTSPEAQAKMGALVQQYGLNAPGVTLSSILGPERTAELDRVAKGLGVPLAALEPYKPWLALISLAVVGMQQAGFDGASGADTVITARATGEGDVIAHFESAEEQIMILANLDEAEMLANFDVTIAQFDDFKGYTDRMLTAWKTGDVEALEADIIGELRRTSPAAFEDLIVARNKKWTAKIDEIMAGEGDYFIAVGAGHLVGEDSVVDMLGDKGFKVERVQ